MLTSDQQEVKKRQRMLKNASEGRAKAAKMRQEKRLQVRSKDASTVKHCEQKAISFKFIIQREDYGRF